MDRNISIRKPSFTSSCNACNRVEDGLIEVVIGRGFNFVVRFCPQCQLDLIRSLQENTTKEENDD